MSSDITTEFEINSLWQAISLPGKLKKSGFAFHEDLSGKKDEQGQREITLRIYLTLGLAVFCAFLSFGSSDSQIWLFMFLLCVPLPALIVWIVKVNDLRWKALATQVFAQAQATEGMIQRSGKKNRDLRLLEIKEPKTDSKKSKYRIAFISSPQLAAEGAVQASESGFSTSAAVSSANESSTPASGAGAAPESVERANLYFDPENSDLVLAELEDKTRLWCKPVGQAISFDRWQWIMPAMTAYLLLASVIMWNSGVLYQQNISDTRKNWVPTQGTIVSCMLQRYGFRWTYVYKAGATSYYSTRIGITRAESTQAAKIGDHVDVLYDPHEPAKSVLSVEDAEMDPVSSGHGLAITLFSFALVPLILGLLGRTKRKPSA